MLVPSKLKEEDEEIIEQAKRLSKRLARKLRLDEDTSGRLAYTLILKKLGLELGEQLHFEETPMKELCSDQALMEANFEIDQIVNNPDLLDLLYESLVPPSYRRKYGQFLTPDYVAEFMASWINQDKPHRVLDPAVGSGIFLDNVIKTSDSLSIVLWGFDIDSILLDACRLRLILGGLQANPLHLRQQNFIKIGSFFTERMEAIICNPPYLNFHDFDRNGLVKTVEARCGIKLSRLTNIYVLFFLQSLLSAKNGAKLAFITPSEFLYTGYGKELKAFLLEHATLDAFILIDFQSLLFRTALTTAIITLFRKGSPKSRHKVRFIRIYKWPTTTELLEAVGEGIENQEKYRIIEVYQHELKSEEKWLKYFANIEHRSISDELVPLSQLAEVDRGIATGFNGYFVLSKSEIKKREIEDEFVVPVISKTIQCKGYNFTVDDLNHLIQNGKKVFLLHVFKKPSPSLREYIKYGEKIKADKRYITKHRSPWYSMEKREPAKILATVFHRESMRFVLNNANIRNLTPFHCVYPKFDDIVMIKALLAYLNSDLCREIQTIKRREYGGGLHKFEPKDLEDIPSLDVTRLSRVDVENLASMFDRLCFTFRQKEEENQIRRELDDLLRQVISKTKRTDTYI